MTSCSLQASPPPPLVEISCSNSTEMLGVSPVAGDGREGPAAVPLHSPSRDAEGLELLLAVFEHGGHAFLQGDKFVYAVQTYLCVSLLKNCMSNQTVVAHLSLKIFLGEIGCSQERSGEVGGGRGRDRSGEVGGCRERSGEIDGNR